MWRFLMDQWHDDVIASVCGAAVYLPPTQHLSDGVSEGSRSVRLEAQSPAGRYRKLQVGELLPGV